MKTTQARGKAGGWLWRRGGGAHSNLGGLLRAGLSEEQGLQISDPERLVWVGGMRRGHPGQSPVSDGGKGHEVAREARQPGVPGAFSLVSSSPKTSYLRYPAILHGGVSTPLPFAGLSCPPARYFV